MKVESTFGLGETVFAVVGDMVCQLTIGQVRLQVTDSPGRPGEELFDNYKPQKGRREEYMCVETGIGTGRLFRLEHLHSTPREAERARINENNSLSDCCKCRHMRRVTGNKHIQCVKPDPDMTGDPHGIENGWFVYPFLFDPVWKTRLCANFEPKGEE